MEKLGLILVVATLALAGAVLYYLSLNPFVPANQTTTVSGIGCTVYQSSFTVVASQSGYNDSIGHGAPSKSWPILCARSGETVTIKVVNEDSVEPHGFAIAGYLDAGITVLPGRAQIITIYVSTPGDYRIYCNVICAVHTFMQSGLLVVS